MLHKAPASPLHRCPNPRLSLTAAAAKSSHAHPPQSSLAPWPRGARALLRLDPCRSRLCLLPRPCSKSLEPWIGLLHGDYLPCFFVFTDSVHHRRSAPPHAACVVFFVFNQGQEPEGPKADAIDSFTTSSSLLPLLHRPEHLRNRCLLEPLWSRFRPRLLVPSPW